MRDEQIIGLLRQPEVILSQGKTLDTVIREIGVTRSTYRWRKDYGWMKMDAKRLKELEVENSRLKRAVADLTLYNLILN